MKTLISGLHHVTALAADPQLNIDFYAGILGLRLVKQTVNFDAPDVYHLYYGDQRGNPGTIMTFFPFSGLRRGKHGNGQMTVTSFSVPPGSLDYWQQRLTRFGITYNKPEERLNGELFIYLQDFDGLGLELVADAHDVRPGFETGPVPIEYAVKGFQSVKLNVENIDTSAELLKNLLNFEVRFEKDNYLRMAVPGTHGQFVDLSSSKSLGMSGSGTIHHLAFATANDVNQLEVREAIEMAGHNVTPVLDRQYFHSIYFREPGGVLFEVATNPPGFTVDEPAESLGAELKLPEWLESKRQQIATNLKPITIDPKKFKD